VADITGVAETVLQSIKAGRKLSIRKRTESRILSVTIEALPDSALVPAKRTWVLINRLLAQGFTKRELAKRLGYANAIQFNRVRVTARNALKVERFYRKVME
jgi:hypothetical protein